MTTAIITTGCPAGISEETRDAGKESVFILSGHPTAPLVIGVDAVSMGG